MTVTCAECGARYDDTFRRTNCPHKYFGMRCQVVGPRGKTLVATTLEQQDRALKALREGE